MARALVTGANRGIGLELVRALALRGDEVVAVCRRSSAQLEQLGVRIEADIDVTDAEGLQALAGRIAQPLDLLINNAGILRRDSLDAIDFEAIRLQFEVNALGPLRTTIALQGRLARNAKVAIVTSRMGSISDNTSGGYYGYRMSKAAVNIAGVSLARDLHARGVAVALLHPGYVATEMTDRQGEVAPAQAARGLLERIDALTLATSGGFWHAQGQPLAW